MTDETKELLELAARAMGLRISHFDDGGSVFVHKGSTPRGWWSPLERSADCFDMECSLKISAVFHSTESGEFVDCEHGGIGFMEYEHDHGGSLIAARRMASTRVAAEIARSLK